MSYKNHVSKTRETCISFNIILYVPPYLFHIHFQTRLDDIHVNHVPYFDHVSHTFLIIMVSIKVLGRYTNNHDFFQCNLNSSMFSITISSFPCSFSIFTFHLAHLQFIFSGHLLNISFLCSIFIFIYLISNSC